MADYAKLDIVTTYSKNSDYSENRIPTDFLKQITFTPDNYDYREIDVTTTAYTVDLAQFNTITAIIVQNTTATNYLNLTYMCQIASLGALTNVDLAANDTPETITCASATFTTNPAAADGCWVRLAAAEDSGNNGLYLVDKVTSATVLTLGTAAVLTTDNTDDDTVTISLEQKNRVRLSGTDGILVLKGDVVPAGDLILQAVTGTCEVRLLILGT